jgi:hypothetical protein
VSAPKPPAPEEQEFEQALSLLMIWMTQGEATKLSPTTLDGLLAAHRRCVERAKERMRTSAVECAIREGLHKQSDEPTARRIEDAIRRLPLSEDDDAS